MSLEVKWKRSGAIVRLLSAVAFVSAVPAFAQQAPAPQQPMSMPASDNAMINLVRLLVEQGVITREKGAALVAQAISETWQVRTPAPTAQGSPELPPPAPIVPQGPPGLPPPAQGTIRVPYIPETVRAQIKEELKAEVLQQARAESWAAPGEGAPEWTKRLTLYGDIRVRSDSRLYSKSNSPEFADYNEINNRGTFNLLGSVVPRLNTTKDRLNNLQVRARLGLEARIVDEVTAGIEIATGNDNSPISTNQSLGGGFAKRDLWLNKAYVRVSPNEWAGATFGRFDNPFLSTELLYDSDLKFDGVAGAVNAGRMFGGGFDLILRGGAFPLDFGDADFPSSGIDKRKEVRKYLFAGQVEAGAKIADNVDVRLAAAYHSFNNVQGQLSEPCSTDNAPGITCSTDHLRPLFLRKGNTVSYLRQFNVALGTDSLPQRFGLVFDYDILNIGASVSFPVTDTLPFRLTGDYVKNLSFKRSDTCRFGLDSQPQTNVGVTPLGGSLGVCDPLNPTPFVGGDMGWQAFATVGQAKPRKRGEWNVFGGYRYLKSDAVLDSLADSDFHGGGTNAKGYFVGGGFALFDNVTVGGRWLSANEVSGEPLAIDVLQLDLEVAF